MKKLIVGDFHSKPSNLKESEDLMEFILFKANELKVDRLEFTGDLLDTHSIVHLSVLEFWQKWFEYLSDRSYKFNTFVLVGNHDRDGSYTNNYSALDLFNDLEFLHIIKAPLRDGVFGYLPYIHDDNEFITEANKLAEQGATVLISHPNFIGATYDNGTPINNGVDPNLLDPRFLHLIGGHIHTENEYGRVWYVGTPRWLTKSCANKNKGIWLVDFDDKTGDILSKEFITTEGICTPIKSLIWKEGEEMPKIEAHAKTSLELVGSSEWVTKQKLELKGLASISSKITDIKKSKVRKAGKSLFEFLSEHYQASPEKRDKLLTYMKGLELLG